MMIDRDINPFMNDEYDLIKRIMFNQQNSQSSCTIATVVAVNNDPISVNVQPCIKYFDKLDGFKDSPVLENIPLAQIANDISSIRLPINPGNVGVLLWFDREVFSWLDSSTVGPKAPDSGNQINELSAIFIPFVQKFSQAPSVKSLGVDFVSSNISLMSELITTMNDVKTTLNDITSLLTDISTFCAAIVAAGGAATSPLTTVYSAALSTAASALSTSLVSITTSIATVTTSITTVTTDLTTFKGDQ